MDQVAARKVLQELTKREDLGNKTCVDCGNPNPQWASGKYTSYIIPLSSQSHPQKVSFAVFLCLQCAGLHRGFGVHIRSIFFIPVHLHLASNLTRQ